MNSSLKGRNDMSETDKMMGDAFGGEFEDVRVSKKKVKKNKKSVDIAKKDAIITSNDEGLEIISSKSNFVGWKIKDKKKTWTFDPNKSVTEWTSWDLFGFAHDLYIKRYGEDWDLLRGGNVIVILKIFEKLERELGSNNYLLMRDYVIYFFERYIDIFMAKKNNNGSFFDYMNRNDVIESFCVSYDARKNFIKYEELKKKNKDKAVTNRSLESAYLLSIGTLVSDYGIIIAANWLVTKKKFKKKDTMKMIFEVCRSMYNKDVLDIVIKSTEKYSPYPDWLDFKNPSVIINRIDENIKINIEFSKNEKKKLAFLNERG
jgi:hypothetical protein